MNGSDDPLGQASDAGQARHEDRVVVEVATDLASLRKHLDAWNKLLVRCPEASVYWTPEWLVPWLATFWRGRKVEFVFAFDDGEPIGGLPLVADELGEVGCKGSIATPVDEFTRDLGLLHAGQPLAALRALLGHVRGETTKVGLRLTRQRAASWVDHGLAEAVRENRMGARVRRSAEVPYAALADGFDAYVGGLSAEVREPWAAAVREFEAAGGAWHVADSATAMHAGIATLVAVENAGAGLVDSLDGLPGLHGLYEAFSVRGAERGWTRLYTLRWQGTPVAAVLGALYRGRFYVMRSASSGEVGGQPANKILYRYVFEHVFESGAAAVEFGSGLSSVEMELCNHVVRFVDLCAFADENERCVNCDA